MKKILLALALCLALCVSLLGCGEKKTGADYLFDSLDNLSTSVQNKKLDKFAANTASGREAAIGIADANALVSLIGTGVSGLPTLENITLTSKVKGETQAFELGVTMNDKPYAMSLIGNADQLVLVTDMLSKNYGITVEEIRTMLAGNVAAEALDSFGATQDALETQAALERYLDLLETTLRDKVEFVLAENGKNVVVNFALTPENAADVCAALYAEAKEDSFIEKLLQTSGVETDALFAMSAEEVRTEVLNTLTDGGFTANFAAEIVRKGEQLVALNGDITANGETAKFGISSTEDGVHAVLEADDDTIEVSVAAKDNLFRMDFAAAIDDSTVVLQVAFENGIGNCKFSMDDSSTSVDAAVDMTYTLTDKTLDVKIGSITISGQTIDLSDAGVTLHVGGEFTMPEMPAEYTSVADFGDAEWQAVVTDLLTKNPELLTLAMSMMQ
jgi:lipoprotein